MYARFDWQIISARRNDRSRERKKNHGSRASFRMCGTRVNKTIFINIKTKKTTGDPRVPARFVTILKPIHAVGCLLYRSPTPLGKTRYSIVHVVLRDDWRAVGRSAGRA